jgi:hypothetical protein
MHAQVDELQSERIIVQAPLSLTGSTKRILRLTEPDRPFALRTVAGRPWWKSILLALMDGLIVLVIGAFMLAAWCFDLFWYLIFGILLVPYRLIRRSDRDRKRDALQHREMLDAALAAQATANRRPNRDER